MPAPKLYLALAKHFIDVRGNEPGASYSWIHDSYMQSHLPVREQQTAEGHAVRAVYLYNG
ncbi:MAG: glycoside hydrolase family 127 protein, partial [Clostridia bacterium]|nr:glycoside hydrolase family 127 protein [Clostridia bacterium]